MGLIQVVGLVIGAVCGVVLAFGRKSETVSPHDAKAFEARYKARGLMVVAMRRIGTDRSGGFGLGRNHPIRKYEIELESLEGHRQMRLRGVSRGDYGGHIIWRYDSDGRREHLR